MDHPATEVLEMTEATLVEIPSLIKILHLMSTSCHHSNKDWHVRFIAELIGQRRAREKEHPD